MKKWKSEEMPRHYEYYLDGVDIYMEDRYNIGHTVYRIIEL
jgi:hypothetical protein